MPQANIFLPFVKDGVQTPANLDTNGNLQVTNYPNDRTALALATAQVLKAAQGRVMVASVTVAGSATGGIYDVATSGAASSANLLYVIPTSGGVYNINMPTSTGIYVSPGTGQTVSVSYI